MHRRFKRNNSSDSPLPMREDDDMDQNSFSVKILIFLVLALVGVFFVIRARSPGNIDDDGDFDSPYMLLLDAGEIKRIEHSIYDVIVVTARCCNSENDILTALRYVNFRF